MRDLPVGCKLLDRPTSMYVWGHASDGTWWALLSWTVTKADRTAVLCCAWCPSSALFPSGYHRPAEYADLVRLRLPADQGAWPTLWRIRGTQAHNFGPVTEPFDGQPPGVTEFGSYVKDGRTVRGMGSAYG